MSAPPFPRSNVPQIAARAIGSEAFRLIIPARPSAPRSVAPGAGGASSAQRFHRRAETPGIDGNVPV